jgi:hypothetical protein
MDDFADLIGLTFEAAEEALTGRGRGLSLRATQVDGDGVGMTMDIRMDRVNVALVNDVVTEVFGIG